MKRVNFIVKLLIVVLLVLVVYIAISMFLSKQNKPVGTPFKFNGERQTLSLTKNWSEVVEKLETKLKQDASLNVLQGDTEIQKTYTTKDSEGKGNALAWLGQKLHNLGSRTITIHTKYKFGYAFDISDVIIEDLGNGKVRIILRQGDLHIKYIEEINGEREIVDEYGVFGIIFSPQETNALMQRTYIHVQNTINNSTGIRYKAMEFAKEDIRHIAEGFGFREVEFDVLADNLLDNEEVVLENVENR